MDDDVEAVHLLPLSVALFLLPVSIDSAPLDSHCFPVLLLFCVV